MTAFIAICTEEYINYYKQLYKSVQKWSPKSRQILYYIGARSIDEVKEEFDQVVDLSQQFTNCNSKYNTLERICSLRAQVVLDAFKRGYDNVIFCGAKIEFYSSPWLIEALLNDHNAVVTPHITQPLPEDGLFPSNASVSFTGHISTDLVAFKNTPEIVTFLKWQDEIMKNNCKTTNNTYLDQSWLNFLPFFVENVKILLHPGYNAAYWNWHQREFIRWNNKWVFDTNKGWVDRELVCFQFSGLDLNNPESISTHQNRYKAEGDFLEFLKDYARRVKCEQ